MVKWTIIAPPFPISFPAVPTLSPVIPAFSPRHSRESGNPQTGNVILAKAGTSPPPEIMYKSQPADPLSLYGLTGVG